MIGIDTNILIRYIIKDDEQQAKLASKLIRSNLGNGISVFINNIVLCELVWVLERGYKFKKSEIINLLRQILSTKDFAFEQPQILWIAFSKFINVDADFSDALINELNKFNGCTSTYSFDQKGIKSINFNTVN